MPYLVDGHNLIPKLGLRLDSFDDERDLLLRLQEFCRLRRVKLEVFFDGAPPGQPAMRKAGVVSAHFVRRGSSADAAIEAHLERLKKAARNWTVVSSDKRVQRAAGAAGAGVMSAEEFVQEMFKARAVPPLSSKGDAQSNPDEVEEWLRIFKNRVDKKE